MAKPRKGVQPKSPAHIKGWETRRRNHPLNWGESAIAKNHEITEEKKQVEKFMVSMFEADIEVIKAQRALDKVLKKKAMIQQFGEVNPPRWKVNLYKAMSQFIEDRDAKEDSETIKKSYNKWWRLKTKAKDRLLPQDFHNLIALYGSNLNLSMEGSFSVQRFIDSP